MPSDLKPEVLMVAMLLATTSIWRCSAIWRDRVMSCAFSIGAYPRGLIPEACRIPMRPASAFTLQKPCQSKNRNDFSVVADLPDPGRRGERTGRQDRPGKNCRFGTVGKGSLTIGRLAGCVDGIVRECGVFHGRRSRAGCRS